MSSIADESPLVTRQSQLARLWESAAWRSAVFVASCAVLGALGGALWAWLTPLSAYTIQEDLRGYMSERDQANVIAGDAWFVVITAVLGLVIGVAGWLWFHARGWLAVLLPLVGAFAAALMAWRLGVAIGTSGFGTRLAAAQPGDRVPIDLELRSLSALIVAPFAAITPIMLLAAFWPERVDAIPDDED